MSPHTNRGRITLRPLGSDKLLAMTARMHPTPPGAERLADVIEPERGWLIRYTRTGSLAMLIMGGGIRTMDKRKAKAALVELAKPPERPKPEMLPPKSALDSTVYRTVGVRQTDD